MATSGFKHGAAGAKRLFTVVVIGIATTVDRREEIPKQLISSLLTEALIPSHHRM